MAYIASDNITVFPNAQRAATNQSQLKARKMTEENVVGITNHIVDNSSYVISENATDSPFKFVIGGYYVEISSFPANILPLYAHIKLSDTNGYKELVGQDTDPNDSSQDYKGVYFSKSNSESGYDYHLQLLDVLDGNVYVPNASRVRFLPDRLDISKIAYIGGITVS